MGRYLPRALCGGSGWRPKGAAAHGVCSGGVCLMARAGIAAIAAVVGGSVVGVAMVSCAPRVN